MSTICWRRPATFVEIDSIYWRSGEVCPDLFGSRVEGGPAEVAQYLSDWHSCFGRDHIATAIREKPVPPHDDCDCKRCTAAPAA